MLNVTSSAANVVSLLRDDMTNATSRISHVTNAPRDDMDMKVGNGLAGGSSLIEAHVESVDGVTISQEALCLGNGFANILKLFPLQVVPNRRMSLRNNEDMPLCDRIPIPNRERMLGLKDYSGILRFTEGTAIVDPCVQALSLSAGRLRWCARLKRFHGSLPEIRQIASL